MGTGTSYHIIVLHRYSPVRATGIIPKDTCSKAMTRPVIVQQGCDRPHDIKAKRTNFWPIRKAMTGTIIVLRRYGSVQATQIMTEGTYNKAVTGQMIKILKGQIYGQTKCTLL